MDPVPTRRGSPAPTIRDVARHAKVGVGTVSRVLNDSPLVSDEARVRVRKTIDELGYRPQLDGATAVARPHADDRRGGAVLHHALGRGAAAGRRRAAARRGEYDLLLFDVETLEQRADAFEASPRATASTGS